LDPAVLNSLTNPFLFDRVWNNAVRAANPEVTCNKKRAGEFEKFYGWRDPISWSTPAKVEKIIGTW
jgi:hypothetical protein